MQTPIELLAVVFGGTFFGSFLGPLLLDEYRRLQRSRRWLRPRQATVKMLYAQSGLIKLSLRDIAKAIGLSDEDAREVLISLNGVGTTMDNGQEGWILDRTKIEIRPRQIAAEISNP